MIVLAIETATPRVGVALADHDGLLGLVEIDTGRRHAETLLPAIEFVCRHADVARSDIGALAVDIGPGLFTGMRVGLATAKALGSSFDVPIVPLTSLEVLAHSERHDDGVIASVIDARKGQIFFQFFRSEGDAVRGVSEPVCGDVDDLVAALNDRGQDALCLGDGAHRYREALLDGPRCTIGEARYPSASTLASLAERETRRENWVEPIDLRALYLREPDALINWSTRESA